MIAPQAVAEAAYRGKPIFGRRLTPVIALMGRNGLRRLPRDPRACRMTHSMKVHAPIPGILVRTRHTPLACNLAIIHCQVVAAFSLWSKVTAPIRGRRYGETRRASVHSPIPGGSRIFRSGTKDWNIACTAEGGARPHGPTLARGSGDGGHRSREGCVAPARAPSLPHRGDRTNQGRQELVH